MLKPVPFVLSENIRIFKRALCFTSLLRFELFYLIRPIVETTDFLLHQALSLPFPSPALYTKPSAVNSVLILTDIHEVLHYNIGSVLSTHCPCF